MEIAKKVLEKSGIGEGSWARTVLSKALSGNFEEAKMEISKKGFQGVKFNLTISIENPQDATINILGGTYSIKGKCRMNIEVAGVIPGTQFLVWGATKKPEFQVKIGGATLAELVKNATASDHPDDLDVEFDVYISLMVDVPMVSGNPKILNRKETIKLSAVKAMLSNDVAQLPQKKVQKAITTR